MQSDSWCLAAESEAIVSSQRKSMPLLECWWFKIKMFGLLLLFVVSRTCPHAAKCSISQFILTLLSAWCTFTHKTCLHRPVCFHFPVLGSRILLSCSRWAVFFYVLITVLNWTGMRRRKHINGAWVIEAGPVFLMWTWNRLPGCMEDVILSMVQWQYCQWHCCLGVECVIHIFEKTVM